MERRIESQQALEAARSRPPPIDASRRPPGPVQAGGPSHVDGRLHLHTDLFDFGLDFRNNGSASASPSTEGSLPDSPNSARSGSEAARHRRLRSGTKRPTRRASGNLLSSMANDRALSAATGVAYQGGVPLAAAIEGTPPPRRIRRSLLQRGIASLRDELACHDGPRGGLPYRLTAMVLRITLLLPGRALAAVLGYAFGLCLGIMDAIRHGLAQVPESLWTQFFRAARQGRGDIVEPAAPGSAGSAGPAPSEGSLSPGGRTPSLPSSPLSSPAVSAGSMSPSPSLTSRRSPAPPVSASSSF